MQRVLYITCALETLNISQLVHNPVGQLGDLFNTGLFSDTEMGRTRNQQISLLTCECNKNLPTKPVSIFFFYS